MHQAVIHCEIVRQAARVVAMDRERLRSGDRAHVRFRFLQRPEYLTPGMVNLGFWHGSSAQRTMLCCSKSRRGHDATAGTAGTRFVFREGRTKGIGMVAHEDDE